MVKCPYCEKEIEINHDDGFGYEEGVTHQQECPHCEKTFVFETYISFDYELKKAECLNGGEQCYILTTTIPREFSKMECKMCGDKREPTESERLQFNIGTKQGYFESLSNKTR
jgi:hypothetical protein